MSIQDDEKEVSSRGYREVTGRNVSALLNPRPAVIVGVYCGKANFTTVAWTTPLSHKPPMLALALRQSSRSYQMIAEVEYFSLNTVDSSSLDLVRRCGNESGNKVDKDAFVEYRLHSPFLTRSYSGQDATQPSPSHRDKEAPGENEPKDSAQIPIIDSALSFLSCRLESLQEVGDHGLIIASVEDAWTKSSLDDRGRIHSFDTLLCLDHDLFTVAAKENS